MRVYENRQRKSPCPEKLLLNHIEAEVGNLNCDTLTAHYWQNGKKTIPLMLRPLNSYGRSS